MNATSKSNIKPWLYGILVLVVIALATAWIVRATTPKRVASTTATTTPSPTAAAYDPRTETPNRIFSLVADAKHLISGPSVINVAKGDSVRVNITAQGNEEIHVLLEGYDINTEAHPTDDSPGGFSFIADKLGQFAFYTSADTAHGETVTRTKIGTIIVK